MKRTACLLALAIALLSGAALLRPGLARRRRAIGLEPDLPGGQGSLVPVVAALGVLRPLVVNGLWLRSASLQREGRFFESVALVKTITALQPRLPRVWSFLAWNLACNIGGEAPAEDRYRWLLEGVTLLRDRGLAFNPDDPRLQADLAFFFVFKIGLDLDDAHVLYKESLAAAFEPPGDVAPSGLEAWWRSRIDDWGLEEDLLRALGPPGGPGPGPDLRSPDTHALYWSTRGLESERARDDAFTWFRLRRFRLLALQGLLARGLVVRSVTGRGHATLPDPRWARAIEEAIRAERELWPDDAVLVAEADDLLRAHRSETVFALAVTGRAAEAAERLRELSGGEDRGLDAFLLEGLGEEGAPPGREVVVASLAELLRGAIWLRLIDAPGLEGLALGLDDVAARVASAWGEHAGASGKPLPSLARCRLALAAEARRAVQEGGLSPERTRRLRARLAEAFPAVAAGGGDIPSPGELGLPPPGEAPLPGPIARWRLDALDPRWKGAAP